MPAIRTLLLTGQNNHDWETSSPYLKKLLEDSGRFVVTLVTDPSAALEDADALANADLLFLDYNGEPWTDAARTAFENAVRGGMGVVVLHAPDNAFTGWVEYEKIVGLLWRRGTSHGRFHEFPVTFTDRDHPITRGLDDYKTTDELYHSLVHMHDVPYQVLATAFSSTESGGSGKDEPVHVLTQYGEGRIFHQVLGHVWKTQDGSTPEMCALTNPGFCITTLRGAEWAATGEVTIEPN